MHRLRTALLAGALVCAGLGVCVAAAASDECVDDQTTCPSGLADDAATVDVVAQPTPVPSPDALPGRDGTVGPPVVVDPFPPLPAAPAATQPGPLVIAPANGADKQHLPPGPANRVLDP